MDEKLMNIAAVSVFLGVSSSGVYQWVSQRKIPFVKLGRSVRFDQYEISKWLEGKKVKSQDI